MQKKLHTKLNTSYYILCKYKHIIVMFLFSAFVFECCTALYVDSRVRCGAFCAQTLGSKQPQWQSNFVSICYNYLLSSLTLQFLFRTNETRVPTKCINAMWRAIILFISGDVFSSRTGLRGCSTRPMSLVSVLSCPVNSLSTIVCTLHPR